MHSAKDLNFWFALIMILVAVSLSVAVYFDWLGVSFFVGPLRLGHWLGVLGTLFIAIFTPTYYVLKRRYPRRLKAMLNVHIFGTLFSFILISIHFAQQMGRPPDFFPNLGTGLALFIAVCTLATTGILRRFQLGKQYMGYYRTLHTGATMTFYIIVIIHLLHGLGVI